MVVRLLKSGAVIIPQKPVKVTSEAISNSKKRLKVIAKSVIYNVNDCVKLSTGQTRRIVATRTHEHKLITGRPDHLSLIPNHKDQEGNALILGEIHILDEANKTFKGTARGTEFVNKCNRWRHQTAPIVQSSSVQGESITLEWGDGSREIQPLMTHSRTQIPFQRRF